MVKQLQRFDSNPVRVIACLVGMLVPTVWLWSVATPSHEAVKIRNAWLADMGSPADFDWVPGNEPATYLAQRGPPADSFVAAVKQAVNPADGSAVAASEFERALAISRHLFSGAFRGGPIMADTAIAYREITQRGRGYCADFTQVFNALAHADGMAVREWGIAFDAFGAGHAFNEVYDCARGKWVLVDSFHSLYFTDPASREPLSVIEVHDRLLGLGAEEGIAIERIHQTRFPFRSEAIALDYYRRGMPQLYLWWGNNVLDYDRNRLVHAAGKVSRSLEQATAIALGLHPRIRIYPVGVSHRDVDRLFLAERRFRLAAIGFAISVAIFLPQLAALLGGAMKRAEVHGGSGR